MQQVNAMRYIKRNFTCNKIRDKSISELLVSIMKNESPEMDEAGKKIFLRYSINVIYLK